MSSWYAYLTTPVVVFAVMGCSSSPSQVNRISGSSVDDASVREGGVDSDAGAADSGSSSSPPSQVCVATLAVMPDAGVGSIVEWQGLVGSTVTTTPEPYPLAVADLPDHQIAAGFHGIDSAGEFYFNWDDLSPDAAVPGGFLKLNSDATLAWQVAVDPAQLSNHSGSVNAAGEVAIAGTANLPNGATAAYTAEYRPDGTLAWSAQFQHPSNPFTVGYAASIEADGTVVSAAYANLPSVNDGEDVIVLIKYAADGTPIWTKGYCAGTIGQNEVESLVTDAAGDIYLSTNDNTFGFLPDGTPLFASPYSGALSLSSDESAVYVFDDPLPIGDRPILTKIDSKTGDVDWIAHFASTAQVLEVWDFVATSNGLYMLGRTGSQLPFWARFDDQGNQQWFEPWAPGLPDGGVDKQNYALYALGFHAPNGPDAGVQIDGGGSTDAGDEVDGDAATDADGQADGASSPDAASGSVIVIAAPGIEASRVGVHGTPLPF